MPGACACYGNNLCSHLDAKETMCSEFIQLAQFFCRVDGCIDTVFHCFVGEVFLFERRSANVDGDVYLCWYFYLAAVYSLLADEKMIKSKTGGLIPPVFSGGRLLFFFLSHYDEAVMDKDRE